MIYKPPKELYYKKGNQLKDFLQSDIVNIMAKEKSLVLEAGTGFGKTNTAILAINRVRLKNNLPIVIIVPTNILKTQWESKIIGIDNIYIYVINSYTMTDKVIKNGFLLIIDECHRCLNEESIFFSKVLKESNFNYQLLLSATLEKKHKEFLINHGINNYYEISIFFMFKNSLLPFFTNYNIPVELNEKEKGEMLVITNEIDKCIKTFNNFNITNPYQVLDFKSLCKNSNYTEKQLIGIYTKWKKEINKRKMLIQNCENKFLLVKLLLEKFNNDKILIFCSSIKSAEKMMKENPFSICLTGSHSVKQRKLILDSFYSGHKNHLISIKTLIEGFDVKNCSFGIRTSYSSSSLNGVQSLGRLLRIDELDENKNVSMFNFYVDDFIINKQLIESQEKKWLKSSQRNIINVKNLTINELLQW